VTNPTNDPLRILADGDRPVEPDPAFATRLRGILLSLLTLPELDRPGGSTMTVPPYPIPAAIPYLAIGDGRAHEAISWYGRIFGATVNGEPYIEGDRIGHAELQIGPGVIYLSDEAPDLGVVGPGDTSDVSLMLRVADADATLAAGLAAGAHSNRTPYDGYGQRNAWMVDPFGHRWGLNSPLAAG